MIDFQAPPGARVIELGCGASPHPAAQVHVDIHKGDDDKHIDFACDFNAPLPIADGEWDAVISIFALEHVSYVNVPGFLKEINRIMKPGAKAAIITANTQAQLRWVLDHEEGWDGKDLFLAASEKLFGDQRYAERLGNADISADSHKAFFSPAILTKLFEEAGFENISLTAFGERRTDLLIQAVKPITFPQEPRDAAAIDEQKDSVIHTGQVSPVDVKYGSALPAPNPVHERMAEDAEYRASLFDRRYFDCATGEVGGYAFPGYRDFPFYEIVAQHVLNRKPKSVLELGAGRGYVLKRLQDASVHVQGLDISKHACMTCVAGGITCQDACNEHWGVELLATDPNYDLGFSTRFWEYVPELLIPTVVEKLDRHCQRNLHSITFAGEADASEIAACTLRSRQWWKGKLPASWEIVSARELESGIFPESRLRDPQNKTKLNIGCYLTQFHNGWTNLDVQDLDGWAKQNGTNYLRCDVRQGLPFETGSVSLVFAHHMLEHMPSYPDGIAFLRECRRVIKPEGAMRLVVPNARVLATGYASNTLSRFDEMNGGCAEASTQAGKFWALLHSSHAACHDEASLDSILREAGFVPYITRFRHTIHEPVKQILRECLEMDYGGTSLFVDALPAIS